MSAKYSEERNVLMLMSLMKQHGVRKIIASPGTTNVSFVVSCQRDPYLEVYSSVDERSAAYIACGMAEESGEPVALSCTQATASRNYFPESHGGTLPKDPRARDHVHAARCANRSEYPTGYRPHCPAGRHAAPERPGSHHPERRGMLAHANIAMNRALLELRRDGGGPAHVDLATTCSEVYDVDGLPQSRAIFR